MTIRRRDFLGGLGGAACLPSVLSAFPVELLQQAATQSPPRPVDPELLNFWATTAPPISERGGQAPKRYAPTMGQGAAFLVYSGGQFRDASAKNVAAKELKDADAVNVQIWVHGFKPSEADRQKYSDLQSAALKVDLVQGQKLLSEFQTLASTGLAAIFPNKKGKLPSFSSLNWDAGSKWGTQQVVPLSGGYGSWRWNLILQRRASFLAKVFGAIVHEVIPAAGTLASVLTLPAIAVPALAAFNLFLGKIQANIEEGEWLLCDYPVGVYATQTAVENPRVDTETAVPLVDNADYIVVPRTQYSLMKPADLNQKKYEVQAGMIVPHATNENDVPDAAEKALPDVTYVSLKVRVTPSTGAAQIS
jgi:hypothetical protein